MSFGDWMTPVTAEADYAGDFDLPDAAPTADAAPRRRAQPGATYRLQLREDVGFAAVADLIDYFADLGVTHLYLSPIMQARSGSTHGYDVVDPTVVSPALGGEDGLRALASAAEARDLRLIVDIVPNHMAASAENPLWEQLLAEGMSGPAGSLFDVDWRPPLPTAEGKVVLPILAEPYGDVLASGDLTLVRREGIYRLRYGDRTFPLRRETLAMIDTAGGGRAFAGTPGVAGSWQPLHDLLEQQHYRLVHWRIGNKVINYRRFFAVDDLVAVRSEVPEVFEDIHAKVIDLIADGVIDGLRVDHPDGLRDPERYMQHLSNRSGVWIVAEKILQPGERLPDWPIAGTTGYDFCNDVLGLYINADALPQMLDIDRRLGGGRPFADHAIASKRAVLDGRLCADLDRLAARLWAATQQQAEARDVTLDWCRQVLARTLEQFAVYRTYVDPETGTARDADRAQISAAVARARDGESGMPAQLWDYLERLLSGDAGDTPARLDVLSAFQQLSSAVMAKGIEDTAFYRYRPLLAACEVGGDPTRPARSIEEFQQGNVARAERHPTALLSTATHDSKRGEDTRLRMAALTEVADAWGKAVDACEDLAIDPTLPAQSRYLVYQTAVGIWPLQGDPDDTHRQRLADYVVKAEREAGLFTTWTDADESFEGRVGQFARTLLNADTLPNAFNTVVQRCAEIAMVAGLGQVVLRTLSPGVPDVYQGTEIWDDSLVDPDNRRQVPFTSRSELLGTDVTDASVADLLARRRDGRIKMLVLRRAMAARTTHHSCVGSGSGYLPLTVMGQWAAHVVGFARVASNGSDALLVVAPRLPGVVMGDDQADPPLAQAWGDTALKVPSFLHGEYRDIFSAGAGDVGDMLGVAAVLGSLPVAVLTRV
jgi:malto-oligosyltrehalose synthase